MLAFHFRRLWCMSLTDPSFCLPLPFTVGRVVRGAYSLEGTYAIFVPKTKDQLAKDVSGYCKFWNTEHCKVLQFLPTATKERRNSVVDYRWKLHQTPQTVARDFTKKNGFTTKVRATCHLIT